jgi:hypothetical protein
MMQTNLELVHRTNGSAISVHPIDPLLSGEPQRRLAELYNIYDIRCLCTTDGVVMHIRRLSKTGLFFVADNPTSGMHSAHCKLATSRIGMTDAEAVVPSPLESVEFNFSEREDRPNSNSSLNKASVRKPNYPHTRKLYLLLLTLLQNAYCNIAFSAFRSFKTFAGMVIEAKGRKVTLKGSDLPVNKLVFYAAGGLQIAIERATKTNGVAFWLAYTPEVKVGTGQRSITLYETEHHGVAVIRPYQATGPHIALGVVTSKGLVEVALQPIVSNKFVFPVFSDQGRESAIQATELLPVIKNETITTWITTELWGDDAGPGQLYHVEKNIQSGKRNVKTFPFC